MNWKKLILWSLPLWVIVALLFGVRPIAGGLHDNHAPHAEDHVERLESPAPSDHEHYRLDPEHIRHHVDEWLWVMDYIVEYGNAFAGLLLAIGQVVILLKLKGGVNK